MTTQNLDVNLESIEFDPNQSETMPEDAEQLDVVEGEGESPAAEEPEATPSEPKAGATEATIEETNVGDGDDQPARVTVEEQRQLQTALQQHQAEVDRQQLDAFIQQEGIQYRQQLEAAGIYGAQQAPYVEQFQGLQRQKVELALRAEAQDMQAQQGEKERRAKYAWGQKYSKDYGVPLEQLMKAKSHAAMEVIALKYSIAQDKASKTPSTQLANSTPAAQSAGGRQQRADRLANMNRPLTDGEFAELERLRQNT
jgi:hypothetical protein